MKKWLVFFIVLIVIIGLGLGIFYMVPKTVDKSLKGVEYQLGSSNHQLNTVTINIKGKVHHSFLGKRIFVGTVNIVGASYPNLDKNHPLTITFGRNGMGYMNYSYFKNGQAYVHGYGVLFANKDFSKVTIEEFRKDKNGKRGWTSGNGWMITGPANNKDKALQISNNLMKKSIVGKLK